MIRKIKKIFKKLFKKRWFAYEDKTKEIVVPLDKEALEKIRREIQEHIGVYE